MNIKFSILLSLVSVHVFAQQPHSKGLLPIHQQATELFARASFDSALLYFKQAGTQYLAEKDWEMVAEAFAAQAEVYQALAQEDSAFDYLEKATAICDTHLPDNQQIRAKIYEVYGKVYDRGLFEYGKALNYYEKALQLRTTLFGEENILVGQSHNLAGKAYVFLSRSDEAQVHLKKAETIFKNLEGENSANLSDVYTNSGQLHFVDRNYGTALEFFQKALAIWVSNEKPTLHPSLSLIYMRMGNAHIMYKGSYSKAVECYKKGADIEKEVYGEEHPGVGRFYGNLGLAYQYKQDYDRSLFYYEQSLNIQRRTLPADHPSLGILYMNMGILYKNMEQYEEAIHHYQLTESIYKKHYPEVNPRMARLYNNYSNALLEAGEYEKVRAMTQKSIATKKELYGEPDPRLVYDYGILGKMYLSLNNLDSALFCAQQSLAQLGEPDGRSLQKARILNDFAYIYHKQASYEASLEAANEALFHLGAHPLDTQFEQPQMDSLLAESIVIRILRNRGIALMGIFNKAGNQQALQSAYDNYIFLDEVLRQVIGDDRTQASKLFQLSVLVSVYEKATACALRMFEATQNVQYQWQAFQFAEESKAVLLAQNLYDTKAREFNLPDSIQLQEEVLKENLVFYKNRLSQYADSEAQKDSVYWERNKQYLQARSAYEDLLDYINTNFPAYYRLKYQDLRMEPALLQSSLLHDKQALLEFMVGEEDIYSFLITKNNFQVFAYPSDSLLQEATLSLRQGLLDNDFKQYTRQAHFLYNKLFQPVETYLEEEKVTDITVVADSYLNYLPFEALVRQAPVDINDYSVLDYLIRDYDFNYQYSATLAYENNIQKKTSVDNLLLGFAPDFSSIGTQELVAYNDITRDNLEVLKGATTELSRIGELMNGNCLFAKEATEENFKQLANQYRVIHLATHAIVDDENPSFSRLIFSAGADSTEDGHLHSYELYNLRLNAELVTLSACNTGFGKIQEGEGIMSLARGFAYAGCPNIVMSLWPASDKATARLMEIFYEGLTDGLPKDAALRHAKLQYLKVADPQEANPYYWANFVFIGEPSPLKTSAMPVRGAVAIMAGIILLFSGIMYFIRNRKK